MIARLVLACAVLALGAFPAMAERLITSLSHHRVFITSSYTGEELVLFGAIEPDRPGQRLRNAYDVAVTVVGPRQTMVTRRKERTIGIWVNADSRMFENVPSYLAMLANRSLYAITTPENQRRLQLGLDFFQLPQRIGPDLADTVPDDPFRSAFVRLKISQGLYREEPNAVTFLTPHLFRATIPLPAVVPIGTYEIDVKLFAEGALITRTSSALEIIKVGFEQFVAETARHHGILYGLATAMMALVTGWLASVVFRRD